MNRIAFELLSVKAGDRVLELGFGPGQAIEMLADETEAEWIAGVDPSAEMVEQASRRNKGAIRAGQVFLLAGVGESLPFPASRFSHVFAVNNFHDWQSQPLALAEIRRVLEPGGLLLLCLRRAPARPTLFSKPGVSQREIDDDLSLLAEQGFREIRVVERKVGQGVVCLLANC